MTRGHLSSDRPATDLAPPPTGPAPGAERPWLQHEGCEGRIRDDGERIAELEAEVERLRAVVDWVQQYQREWEMPDGARDLSLRASLRQAMFDAAGGPS